MKGVHCAQLVLMCAYRPDSEELDGRAFSSRSAMGNYALAPRKLPPAGGSATSAAEVPHGAHAELATRVADLQLVRETGNTMSAKASEWA